MSADPVDIGVLSGVCVDLLYRFEAVSKQQIIDLYNERAVVPLSGPLSSRCFECACMLSGGEVVRRRSGKNAFVWGIRRCAPVVVVRACRGGDRGG